MHSACTFWNVSSLLRFLYLYKLPISFFPLPLNCFLELCSSNSFSFFFVFCCCCCSSSCNLFPWFTSAVRHWKCQFWFKWLIHCCQLLHLVTHTHTLASMHVTMCVCVWVSEWERERVSEKEREREGGGGGEQTDRQTDTETDRQREWEKCFKIRPSLARWLIKINHGILSLRNAYFIAAYIGPRKARCRHSTYISFSRPNECYESGGSVAVKHHMAEGQSEA